MLLPVVLLKNGRLFSASAEARPTSKNILAKEGGPEKLGTVAQPSIFGLDFQPMINKIQHRMLANSLTFTKCICISDIDRIEDYFKIVSK